MRLDIREGRDLERYHFIAGPRTVELFERVFAALFRDHRRVAGRPPLNEDTDGLDGVVEVKLAQVSSYAMDYHVTLFELSGREVYEWRARGSIARPRGQQEQEADQESRRQGDDPDCGALGGTREHGSGLLDGK